MSSSLCNFLTRSQRFLELVKDGRVFQCGNVLRDFLATGDDAQKTAHDFARTGLRQVGAEADFFRTGNRADLARHPFAQVGGDVFRVLAFRQFLFEDDEGANGFTGQIVRLADNGGFGNHRMSGQHGFDFHRAKGVTRNVQHVVDTTGDGEVSGLRVTDRAVAGLIQSSAEFFRPVMGLVAFVVAPDGTDPWKARAG